MAYVRRQTYLCTASEIKDIDHRERNVTTYYDLTVAVEKATADIRKIELRPGYLYDTVKQRVCDKYRQPIRRYYHPKQPNVAAVRLEKRDGRRIWAREDLLFAIVEHAWPKNECLVCGVQIPYLWAGGSWLPDIATEREHVMEREHLGRGNACSEALMQEQPPNEGTPRNVTFGGVHVLPAEYNDDDDEYHRSVPNGYILLNGCPND